MVANPLLLMERFQGGEWILLYEYHDFVWNIFKREQMGERSPPDRHLLVLKVITRSLSGAHLH